MSIIQNERNLVIGYKFYVFVNELSFAFNKVSEMERTYEYLPLQEGGINSQLRLLRKPVSQPSTMTFQEGGMATTEKKIKEVFNSTPKEILVLLCSSQGKIQQAIAVHNAVLSKIKVSELDAQSSQLVVNTLEVMYTGVTRLPMQD